VKEKQKEETERNTKSFLSSQIQSDMKELLLLTQGINLKLLLFFSFTFFQYFQFIQCCEFYQLYQHYRDDYIKKPQRIKNCPQQMIYNQQRMLKIQHYDNASYIQDIYYIKETVLSSIAKWKGKIIIFWRTSFVKGGIEYGWLNLNQASTTFNTTNFHDFKPIEVLGSIPQAPYYRSRHFKFTKQEEPRVTVLSNGKLALIYNGNTRSFLASQHLTFLEYDSDSNTVNCNNGQYLIHYEGRQKNWLPFEPNPNDGLYLIQQQNPLHIVQLGTKGFLEQSYHTKTVIKLSQSYNLPWKSETYGQHVRGGTPPIKINKYNLFLSFFHTCHENGLYKTYFMGAITFNASHPYNLVSMSQVPIARPELYSGRWVWEGLDYVVYPMGSFIDDKEEFIYVSAGWQDIHSIVMKLEIHGLLASLVPIHTYNI